MLACDIAVRVVYCTNTETDLEIGMQIASGFSGVKAISVVWRGN